jgi:hypothetical protein
MIWPRWFPSSGGLQVADAPVARQSSTANGKPARLRGKKRRALSLHYNCLGFPEAIHPVRILFRFDR